MGFFHNAACIDAQYDYHEEIAFVAKARKEHYNRELAYANP